MDTPLDMLQIKIDRAREELPKETRKAIDSVDWRAVILGMREKKGYSFEQLGDLELETELLLCCLLMPENYPKELEERMKIPKPQVDLLVNEMNELVFKKIKDELIRNTEKQEMFIKKNELPINNNPRVIEVDKHISSPNVFNAKEPIKVVEKKKSPVLSTKTEIETMPQELIIPNIKTSESINKIQPIKIENNLKENFISPKPVSNIPNPQVTTMKGEMDSISSQKLSGSFQIPTIKTQYSLNNLSKEENKTSIPLSDKIKTSRADPYRIDPNE